MTKISSSKIPLIELLKTHDWSFDYTEAHGIWLTGHQQRQVILSRIGTLPDMMLALGFYPRVPEPKQEAYIASIEKAFRDNKGTL